MYNNLTGNRATYFLLGADDPEMAEIESILAKHNQRFAFAVVDGKRVHPGNAYLADPVEIPETATLIFIECHTRFEPGTFRAGDSEFIDHHRPGDVGFGLQPAQFWQASSIGQLYAALNLGKPTKDHLTLAAMDHCMVAARQGKCPGVMPEDVKTLRIKHIARANNTEESEVEKVVTKIRDQLLSAKTITIDEQTVIDFTNTPTGIGYTVEYLAAQEVLADTNSTALLATRDTAEGPEKIALCGAANQKTIEYFMEKWAPSQGLLNIYGAPARGYAGGYRP